MYIYAHRANLTGPNTGNNRPEAIRACLMRGIGVEVDVWSVDQELWLGHDGPTYHVEITLLASSNVMCHAKNVQAVQLLHEHQVNFFCLDQDPFALCSNGLIWANFGCEATPRSIMCSPELVQATENRESFLRRVMTASGVCTDYPLWYLSRLQSPHGVETAR